MALVASSACTIYVDEIYTTNVLPVTDNKILTFIEQPQIDLYTVSKDSTISYLESFEGATGVAKMTATKNWGHFGFKPAQEMSVYADSIYVVMRMYIVKSGSLWLGGGNNCGCNNNCGCENNCGCC